MMSMLFFSLIYGLVTTHDPISENGGLFLSEYLTLKKMLHEDVTKLDKTIYISKMSNARRSI